METILQKTSPTASITKNMLNSKDIVEMAAFTRVGLHFSLDQILYLSSQSCESFPLTIIAHTSSIEISHCSYHNKSIKDAHLPKTNFLSPFRVLW